MAYRWVDHTAELELHVDAPTEAAVFEDALRAFGELIADDVTGERVSLDVDVASSDRAALLVHWLDELVYRAETEGFVPEAVERLELSGGGLAATVRGVRGEPRHLVKGATYSGLAFGHRDDGYHATVVLDV